MPKAGAPSPRVALLSHALEQGYRRDLLDVVAGVVDADLDRPPAGSKFILADLIQGVAFHDIDHAGQIQLLKRLQGISHKTTEPT
ncbi:MAG TPA: hypothetical protein VHU81_04490 [Thermoanaerobaculia bacterium]|jgi:hypothetical protein|nr:hypothetical protein [Thermoanaerobaculia bacterium]